MLLHDASNRVNQNVLVYAIYQKRASPLNLVIATKEEWSTGCFFTHHPDLVTLTAKFDFSITFLAELKPGDFKFAAINTQSPVFRNSSSAEISKPCGQLAATG